MLGKIAIFAIHTRHLVAGVTRKKGAQISSYLNMSKFHCGVSKILKMTRNERIVTSIREVLILL